MKTKVKLVSLIFLSLLYPYLLIDLMLDDTAPWNPIFNNSSFFENNWIALIILIGLFTGILYLGKSLFNEKKEEPNLLLNFIYKNMISLSILVFMYVFSIFMMILGIGSNLLYVSLLYILFFPFLFTTFHYYYLFKNNKNNNYSYNLNIVYLFIGVVLPVILYGLLSAAVI
ncbi:MAG: hypothetical protein KKH92_01095 [Firmicutes bacterium]|nr:hypothetical protein [Bacillota bacterium]